ncbi:redoxin family protein [uncultured Paraglaciecola sp.]|uniref:TlpA family protein disulfide reductase n=1 Tax=uncultured Paraglaciecola sp. TaxID=1765024 RepID=UPI002613F144|nr:redoxin family protein [uncultured Paraglaciecola sp.]
MSEFLSSIANKIRPLKWRILLRDVVLICGVFFAIDAWQSRNLLALNSHVLVKQQRLVALDGETKPLLTPGKPTLIYFFAPWCTVCSLSIGNLEYLDPEKVNVVRVALDYADVQAVQSFADKHNITSQVLLGHAGLKQQFNIQGYPTYYILDGNHKVLAKSYGYSTALGLKLRQVFSG